MIQDDYLLRQIRQVAEAIARMLRLRTESKYEEALDVADSLYEELGIPRGLHDVVDTPTLASMLRHADTIRAVASIVVEEGHIYKAKGDPVMAALEYKRAHELMLEARALEPAEGDVAALLELARLAPWYMLDERYRER